MNAFIFLDKQKPNMAPEHVNHTRTAAFVFFVPSPVQVTKSDNETPDSLSAVLFFAHGRAKKSTRDARQARDGS